MDTPIKEKPEADLRDYLAEERTFLAWVRTGIALMGFGFLVAHFGISEDGPHLTLTSGVQPHELSLWFGTAFIAIGVIVNLFSAWRFMRLVDELNRSQFVHHSLSKTGCDRGLVPGAARHRHVDLHDPWPGVAAGGAVCAVSRHARCLYRRR